MSLRSLGHLFEPERILWVGPDGPAARWVRIAEANLWDAGFAGTIHALHSTGRAPEASRLDRLAPLAQEPCLAIVCLPQADLPALIDGLAGIGSRAVVVIGGGAGPVALDAGQARAMRAAARRHGIRVIGPDRVGVMVPRMKLNAGSAAPLPPNGDLAFVTQSDSIATAMLDWATDQRIGFSRIVSLGESADVELGDILDYLALDLATRAILVHLEGIADARRFMSAARTAARVKPVIVLKAGRQLGMLPPRGQSRRLRLNRDRVYDAAFSRAGIVRVDTIEELFAAAGSLGANAARRGPGLRNGRLALLTNGHAPAELAADLVLAGGGAVVRPTARLYGEIRRAVGPTASLASSIDLGPDAGDGAYAAALDVLLDAPDVDGVLVIHAPAAGIDPGEVALAVATAADRRKPRSAQRPVLAAWLGGKSIEPARAPFEAAAIPVFTTPEAAVRAFLHRVHYDRSQFLLRQVPASRGGEADGGTGAGRIIAAALDQGRRASSAIPWRSR